jgi:hypothetical protein
VCGSDQDQEIGACIATRFAVAPNGERYGERNFFVLFKRRRIFVAALIMRLAPS